MTMRDQILPNFANVTIIFSMLLLSMTINDIQLQLA